MKNIKKISAIAAIVFAVFSLGIAIRDISRASYSSSEMLDGPGEHDGYYVVLFRGSSYCPTCDIMQDLTTKLMDKEPAMKDVDFKVINFELPGNEHYLFDYDLYTTSIVLIEQRDGLTARWKNLYDSWEKAEKSDDYDGYIVSEVKKFRSEGSGAR